jgi:hypothetical protein
MRDGERLEEVIFKKKASYLQINPAILKIRSTPAAEASQPNIESETSARYLKMNVFRKGY